MLDSLVKCLSSCKEHEAKEHYKMKKYTTIVGFEPTTSDLVDQYANPYTVELVAKD